MKKTFIEMNSVLSKSIKFKLRIFVLIVCISLLMSSSAFANQGDLSVGTANGNVNLVDNNTGDTYSFGLLAHEGTTPGRGNVALAGR